MLGGMAKKCVFTIGNQTLEVVYEHIYLGQLQTGEPTHVKEIHCRKNMGWHAYGRHSKLVNGNLPLSLKRKLYNYCILPVLTYGEETWRITKKLERKLRTTQRAME